MVFKTNIKHEIPFCFRGIYFPSGTMNGVDLRKKGHPPAPATMGEPIWINLRFWKTAHLPLP